MIYVISLILMYTYVMVFIHYPEYAVAWAVFNTITYMGLIDSIEYETFEDIAAIVVGWFFAPMAALFAL